MSPRTLKYILDILSVINEIERVIVRVDGDFLRFREDFMAVRTVERNLEIVGEALNKFYDSVDSEILWAIVKRDIPKLKQELELIRQSD